MRFKFPPHFYWVSIAPSPQSPLHTLCIWGAHQNSEPSPHLWGSSCFFHHPTSDPSVTDGEESWQHSFFTVPDDLDSLPPRGQSLFRCTWQPSLKLPAHRDDLGHICKKFFYHAAHFGTCQPIRIILTIGKKCHIEPSSLQEDGSSGSSRSSIMIITMIMMMTKIMLILIRIPGGTLHLIRPPAPGYTPFIHDTTLPLSSPPHIGRIVWIFPPRVNSRPAKLWHNAANETFPDWQCLLSPFLMAGPPLDRCR